MQTKGITDILSSTDIAAEKLCDIDPDWECSSTVKRGTRAILHHYEIQHEKKKKSKQLTSNSFYMSSNPRPGLSLAK
jgi:hypothetical protein